MSNFEISTSKSRLDLALIHDFLSTRSYWALGIAIETVGKSIENSICFGVYQGETQVGFARVISDKATFAYLADVFILEDFRKRGISKQLMEFIINYPEFKGVRRFLLATRDAHTLYAQFSFKPLDDPHLFMQINNPKPYLKVDS